MAMPYTDGVALIRLLQEIDPAAKIVAMSGLSTPEQAAALQKVKVTNFLPKPFTARKLLSTLAEVLGVT